MQYKEIIVVYSNDHINTYVRYFRKVQSSLTLNRVIDTCISVLQKIKSFNELSVDENEQVSSCYAEYRLSLTKNCFKTII
jgi:hypothetical protein